MAAIIAEFAPTQEKNIDENPRKTRRSQNLEGRFTKRILGLSRFIPKAHLRDTYLVMQETMCFKTRTCFPSIPDLAERRGVDVRTLQKHINALELLGVTVRTLRKSSRSSNYTSMFTFPLLNEEFLMNRIGMRRMPAKRLVEKQGCGRYRGIASSSGSHGSVLPQVSPSEEVVAGLSTTPVDNTAFVPGDGGTEGTVKPLPEREKQTTTARAPEARRRESQWKPDPERPKPPTLVRLWRDRRDEQRRERAMKASIGIWDGVETPMTAEDRAMLARMEAECRAEEKRRVEVERVRAEAKAEVDRAWADKQRCEREKWEAVYDSEEGKALRMRLNQQISACGRRG